MPSAQLYIGDIPSDARERDIEDFVRKCGRIDKIAMKGNYAFVDFQDYRDADDAVHDLDGRRLLGIRVRVEKARGTPHGNDKYEYGDRDRGDRRDRRSSRYEERDRSRKRTPVWLEKYGPPTRTKYRVVIGNLSTRCSWQDLKDFCRKAGRVTYAECHKDSERTGLVEFETYDDMKRAMEKLDGSDINGRAITMKEEKERSGSRSRSRSRSGRRRSRSRSHSGSKSPRSKDSRSRSRSRSNAKRSASPSRKRSASPSRKRSASRSKSKSRSASASKDNKVAKKSRSRSKTPEKRRASPSRSKSKSASPAKAKSEAKSKSRSRSKSKSRGGSRSD